ncbi:MAG: nucleotidyltransferase family protein [Phycisphaerae bacterium]
MSISRIIHEQKDQINQIAAKHGVRNVRIFGSVARGEDKPQSDIDFLVEAGTNTSSWFPAGLVLDLEQLLGRHVDVVTEKALNPHIRDYVLREAKAL